MKEIVGAMIGTVITNNPRDIAAAVEAGTVTEFLDRQRMRLMAACDLGPNWTRMSEGPTFFCIDDNGNIQPPPNVEFSGTPAALSPEAPLERRVGPGAQEET